MSHRPVHRDHKLHVIAVLSNHLRFESRWRIFNEFKRQFEGRENCELYVVEAAFKDRWHRVTDPANPRHLLLTQHDEWWIKESMINEGIQRLLPSTWQYVAWVDADVFFQNCDFVSRTIESLQHNKVVQMFTDAVMLGPNGDQIDQRHKSFMAQYHAGKDWKGGAYEVWHPGFAWAARRSAIEGIGLLPNVGIGAQDHHLAACLIGQAKYSLPGNYDRANYNHFHKKVPHKGDLHPSYYQLVYSLQEKCEAHIKRDVGVVPGWITHEFHGRMADRGYQSRWSILSDNQFNWVTDIKQDTNGLWVLEVSTPRQIRMRDQIRKYFRARNEDANTL